MAAGFDKDGYAVRGLGLGAEQQTGFGEDAGVRTALLGSLWIIAITIAFAFPIGLGAADWLRAPPQAGPPHRAASVARVHRPTPPC
mgnify:CR=1 FL=1